METFRNDRLENRKITISDVAEALNVSKTTVSRAISGKGRISEDTRQKVLAYIEKNDYKPNVLAKGLAQKKTFNIGLVIPEYCNLVDMPFFQNSMQGICEEASANDYDVMLVTAAGETQANLERMIANNKVDGVILSRSLVRDHNADFLKAQNIPFVLMGTSKDEEILQVDNNHKAGCIDLVGHMISSGVTRIGLIGGSKNYVVNRTRKQGYREAFQNAKLEPDELLVFEDCDKPDKIELAVKKLVEARAEGIVCMDDAICSAVLQILARKNISIPEKMQVASFYDSTLLRNRKPAVTSLLFDDRALGVLTCRVLLRYMQGEEVEGKTLLGYELISRESTLFGKKE
ncbi:MAG: LacI family DNA-binding transcriptional regulator [Lachnospiraceae bacterium]|nr:LacI family DNA-binding transcriptional regulator [Lachnospiraceae bacterium]